MIERIVANGHGILSGAKYLAIHSTANPGASAANHVTYWKNNPTYAVHAVSDWKEAYHTVPWGRLCYQVGNGNSTCIGIEICEATNEADFMRGMEIARDAIWEMLDMMGWSVDHLRSHDWFRINYGGTDHTDPLPYLRKFGKDWDWFVSFIAEKKNAPVQPESSPENDNGFWYRAHVAEKGWLDAVHDGMLAGTVGKNLPVQAIKIQPPEGIELNVKLHIAEKGWVTYKGIKNGESSGEGSSDNDPIIGTVGENLQIEAIECEVVKNTTGKKLQYQVHIADYGTLGLVDAPYTAGTVGIGKGIEAIRFVLV